MQWKKLIIVGTFVGAGFALALALVTGTFYWYRSRPKLPEPWNTNAIRATFGDLDTYGASNALSFSYILENTTAFDFRLTDASGVSIAAKLDRQRALGIDEKGEIIKIDYPIFVPAGQRVLFTIRLDSPYTFKAKEKPASDATSEERKRYGEELKVYIREQMPNLAGFVLLDEDHRYKIDFPKGW